MNHHPYRESFLASQRFGGPCLLACAAAAIVALAPHARGETFTWQAPTGGDFLVADNWTPSGGPPGSGDIAVFSNNLTDTIFFSGDATASELSFQNTSGALVLNLDGNTLSLEAIAFTLGTAAGHVNDVTVTGGTINHLPAAPVNVRMGTLATSGTQKLTFTGPDLLLTSNSTGGSLIGVAVNHPGAVLNIENGATISTNNSFWLGWWTPNNEVTNHELNITDASLLINIIGRGIGLNAGTLNITNSTVQVGFLDANVNGNTGVINFNSGTLTSWRTRIDNGEVFHIGDGGATAADYRLFYPPFTSGATLDAADGVHVRSNGSISGAGTINGNLAGDAGARLSVALDAPTDTQTTTINGNFDASNFDITLKLGDLSESLTRHDRLVVNGLFTHANSIAIDMADYVAPAETDFELKMIGWTSQSGAPAAVSFINGFALGHEYRSDGLYLLPATLLPGDANRDGRVDGEDFLIWQASFSTQEGATWDDGDFNGDGRVDGEDFLIWQAHFGSVAGSSAVTPEPAALSLLGLAGLLLRRRRT